jgi:hypothetical protein
MPLDVITTAKRAPTTVTEHHPRRNSPFNHPEALIHPYKVSLHDLLKALIQPAMWGPEAALTPSHQMAGKTTTVADEFSGHQRTRYQMTISKRLADGLSTQLHRIAPRPQFVHSDQLCASLYIKAHERRRNCYLAQTILSAASATDLGGMSFHGVLAAVV